MKGGDMVKPKKSTKSLHPIIHGRMYTETEYTDGFQNGGRLKVEGWKEYTVGGWREACKKLYSGERMRTRSLESEAIR